jgi:WS/DGAT/MGAT family acyltransferase
MLTMDAGRVPQHIGAVLILKAGAGFDLTAAQRLLAERIVAVPRLRQRLVKVAPGCGRPVWVDDADFDIGRHVRHVHCPPPGDEQALLDLAATIVTDPLPRSQPLWSAVFVTGLIGDAVALVIVLHHVLADGMGGLAMLASLVDQAARPPVLTFPRPRPSSGQLAADAFLAGLHALGRLPAAWRATRASIAAIGGGRPVRATPCSLIQPTGPRRRLAVVRVDLAEVRAAAHQYGATVNDVVLTAVTGGMHALLERRGEAIESFAVTMPMARRLSVTPKQPANQFGPILIVLPGTGDSPQRLQQTSAIMRARKASTTGSPTVALLAPVFRAATVLGVYHWSMNHQRLLHTLVSNVRGPEEPWTFAGATVGAVIPVMVGEAGNVTVSFVVLSYAGILTITVVADPDHVPDLPILTTALQAELDALTASRAGSITSCSQGAQ